MQTMSMPIPSFEMQPTLIGEKIRIRPLRGDEFEALYKVASDPMIWQQHPQKSRYQRDVFEQYFAGAVQSQGAVVVETLAQEIVGASRYYDFQPEKSRVTIGYTFLARAYWGGSYNHEVKKLMMEHAFRQVERVMFEIGAHNLRSRLAIERIGAKLIGSDQLDGLSHVVYQVAKADFYSGPLMRS